MCHYSNTVCLELKLGVLILQHGRHVLFKKLSVNREDLF